MSGAAREQKNVAPTITTRDRILAAAATLFAEFGYSGTSVRMIARHLGISDPAIHYHFPTKQSLYEALLKEPDYGVLPLDVLPLTRENMVQQVLHLFSWWTARPEFGQMLLRELLSRDEASIAFMSSSEEVWAHGITEPMARLVGDEGHDVSAMLFAMLAGTFWDAILSYGGNFSETVAQPFFQSRVRSLVERAIPVTGAGDGRD